MYSRGMRHYLISATLKSSFSCFIIFLGEQSFINRCLNVQFPKYFLFLFLFLHVSWASKDIEPLITQSPNMTRLNHPREREEEKEKALSVKINKEDGDTSQQHPTYAFPRFLIRTADMEVKPMVPQIIHSCRFSGLTSNLILIFVLCFLSP